jgi:hypothetical protein
LIPDLDRGFLGDFTTASMGSLKYVGCKVFRSLAAVPRRKLPNSKPLWQKAPPKIAEIKSVLN